jgi:hypothetical protein
VVTRFLAISLAGIALCLVPATAIGATGVAPGAEHCPETMGGFKTKRIVGIQLDRAEKRATRNGCEVRMVRHDGQDLIITSDEVLNRNVAVRNGRVKRVLWIG